MITEERLAALEAQMAALVEPPTEYYTSRYSGEEIDKGIDGALQLGGASTPQGAIAALGAGVRKNWLINPFFSINQRGASSYSAGNTVDGWLNSGADSVVAVNSDGVIFSVNQDASGRRYLAQALEDDWLGVEATFSILTQDGTLYTGTGNYPDGVGYTDVLNIPNIGTLRLDAQNPDHQRAYVILNQGASIKLRAAKLEKGAGQTLCYMDSSGVWQLLEQPDPLELLKCQRYQLFNFAADFRAQYINPNYIAFNIPTPITMREVPSIVGTPVVKTITGSAQTGFTFSALLKPGFIRVSATKSNHGLSDALLNFTSNRDGFDANIE